MIERALLLSWLTMNCVLNMAGTVAILMWIYGIEQLLTADKMTLSFVAALVAIVMVLSIRMPLHPKLKLDNSMPSSLSSCDE